MSLARLRAAWNGWRQGGGRSVYWRDDVDLLVWTQRAKVPRLDALLDRLKLRAGMSVLDVGAGTGEGSLRIAQRLGVSGRVIAADIDPLLVARLRAEASRRGLSNVTTLVCGDAESAGEYRCGRHDLVLVYDTVHYVPKPVDFFRGLAASLAPGGRLVIVAFDMAPPPFSREDFADWGRFLEEVRREPADTPFGRELLAPLAPLLEAGGDGAALERAALFHLNRLLDGLFYERFVDGTTFKPHVALTEGERPMADWCLGRLRVAGMPSGRTLSQINLGETRALRGLNRLLIIQRFRAALRAESPAPYLSPGYETRWLLENDPITAALRRAGYAVERVDMPPYQSARVATLP